MNQHAAPQHQEVSRANHTLQSAGKQHANVRGMPVSALLQCKCACGGAPGPTGECEECRKKRESGTLQRKALYPSEAPPIVHEVLRSPGQPLDINTRAFFEPRFGHEFSHVRTHVHGTVPVPARLAIGAPHNELEEEADTVALRALNQSASFHDRRYDFSAVRIHTDAKAAESAQVMSSHAYTVGNDIIFAAGQFAPGTNAGRRLLAHELTHVVQQQNGGTSTKGVLQRAISRELDKIESLLSYGIFDWAITDAEAIKALEMLRALPKYQQAVFFSSEKYVGRLRDNLPEGRIKELDDLEAEVVDIAPPRSEIEEIESRLSYGIFDWVVTDKEAVEALEKLKRLPDSQLAVALGAINYDRLMDNLPDSRKQELIDLVARVSPKTGGLAETGAAAQPGSMLNSITFKSDHGVMQDNTADWGLSGKLLGEPEWFIKGGAEVSRAISQSKGTSVEVDLSLNVLPASTSPKPLTVEGKSDIGLLDFSYTGAVLGGLNRRVSMTSKSKLPNKIAAFPNERVVWTITWNKSQHEIAPALGHTVFVTMNNPRKPEQATVKRMAKAIEIIGDLETLEPHEIVAGIMANWNVYELSVPMRPNIWTFADEITVGGQCIDIVRFVSALIEMVGCPGEADAVVVWAHPDDPTKAIEQIFIGPVGLHTVGTHPHHSDWGAALLDDVYHANAYEAALKFNYGGRLAYYAGGAGTYTTKQEVLEIFRCLAWIKGTGGLKCQIMEVPAEYQGPCPVGSEHTCFVPH
jgi:hypothetical protein